MGWLQKTLEVGKPGFSRRQGRAKCGWCVLLALAIRFDLCDFSRFPNNAKPALYISDYYHIIFILRKILDLILDRVFNINWFIFFSAPTVRNYNINSHKTGVTFQFCQTCVARPDLESRHLFFHHVWSQVWRFGLTDRVAATSGTNSQLCPVINLSGPERNCRGCKGTYMNVCTCWLSHMCR